MKHDALHQQAFPFPVPIPWRAVALNLADKNRFAKQHTAITRANALFPAVDSDKRASALAVRAHRLEQAVGGALQRSLSRAWRATEDDAEDAGITAVEDGDGEHAADVAGLAFLNGGLVSGDLRAAALARGGREEGRVWFDGGFGEGAWGVGDVVEDGFGRGHGAYLVEEELGEVVGGKG